VDPFIPIPIPFTFYLLAIVAITVVCGRWWGYAAVAVSLFLAVYLWTPPRLSLGIAKLADATDVIIWALTAIFIVAILAALQRAMAAEFALAEQLRQQSLELRDKATALIASEAKLKVYSEELESLVAQRTEKLAETLTELESFSYAISHNLRSPLRAMQGFAHLVSNDRETQLTPQSREYLRRIDEAARRMDLLIQDLAVFNRAGADGEIPQSVDLVGLINDLVHRHPEWLDRGGALDVSHAHTTIQTDRTGLMQALDHLLGNAFKFVPPNVSPRVQITAEQDRDRLRIRIRDNGVGVPKEFTPRLFKPFARGHADRDFSGRGIGLAIAKKIIRQLGGNISLETTDHNGSVFVVELPSRAPK
jgi:signal transduction histidine kinase